MSFSYYRRSSCIFLVTIVLFLAYSIWKYPYISSHLQILIDLPTNVTSRANEKLSKIIVVSHFKEDLSWLDLYIGDRIAHIVYTRSSNALINHGREPVAYLQYIVDHYSNLPSLIAFIHGHRTSWHQKDPSDIVVALRALRWNKYSFMPLTSVTTHALFQPNSSSLQEVVNYQLWRDVLQEELGSPPANGTKGHCCATFAVRKEEILKHTKNFYTNIIDYILASSHSDQLTGRTLEYTWHMIFGQPSVIHFKPCDLFFCDERGSISVELAKTYQ
ncbi:hypothetical protein I4U23_004128 [Adineta vaga]|nr:hypothetical protein I4U23_004128 [Adineta vaga]